MAIGLSERSERDLGRIIVTDGSHHCGPVGVTGFNARVCSLNLAGQSLYPGQFVQKFLVLGYWGAGVCQRFLSGLDIGFQASSIAAHGSQDKVERDEEEHQTQRYQPQGYRPAAQSAWLFLLQQIIGVNGVS